MDYKKLYHIMVDASEKAIEAIDGQNYELAKELLIRAERLSEELYIAADEEFQTGETAKRRGYIL